MAKKQRKSAPVDPWRICWGTDVPMRVIREFARAVAERFQPEKIILFGSHAYGTPNDDSDVDILVATPSSRVALIEARGRRPAAIRGGHSVSWWTWEQA